LRNFDASILREATLSELTAMVAKQKISNGKLLSQVMAANYEQVANFPVLSRPSQERSTKPDS
jgi:hypothetical protein